MSSILERVTKATLSLNLAVLVRAARYGTSDAMSKLTDAYRLVDPFQPKRAPVDAIPQVDLADVVNRFGTVLVDPGDRGIDGALPLHELIVLLALLHDRRPAAVLEIGTYFGTTTKILAANRPDAVVHTVDLPPDYDPASGGPLPKDDLHLIARRQVGASFASSPYAANIRQHFGDTATWSFDEARGASFFFIDGSHTYEYVRNDTLKCLGVAARPSTLVWHDCSGEHPGVVKWLTELVRAGVPVKRIRRTTLALLDVREDLAPLLDRLG